LLLRPGTAPEQLTKLTRLTAGFKGVEEATVTNYTYHPANHKSDITVLVIESFVFVFGIFCQNVLIILLLTMPLSRPSH